MTTSGSETVFIMFQRVPMNCRIKTNTAVHPFLALPFSVTKNSLESLKKCSPVDNIILYFIDLEWLLVEGMSSIRVFELLHNTAKGVVGSSSTEGPES